MKSLYEKIFEFRKLTGKVVKSKNNPFFKSKYADLPSVIEATDPALEEVGLIYIDRVQDYTLISEVIDPETGESISSTTPLISVKQDMQGLISAITYARRVSRMTLMGLMAIDDDGSIASGQSFVKPAKIKKITDLILKSGLEADKILMRYGVNSIKDLWDNTADELIVNLEKVVEGKDGK